MSFQDVPAVAQTPGMLAGKLLFATLFVVAGFAHFRATGFFMRIMPPYLPHHRELVLVSGVFEILLGVALLIPATSRAAAWGLVALLIAVFPANIHLYQHRDQFPLPFAVHLLRLPAQGLLIWWAYAYTRR